MPPLFELRMLVNGKHWNHKRINSISIDSYFLGNHFWQNDGDFLMKSCAKQVDVAEEFAHQLLPRNVHYCVIPTKLDEWCSTAMSIWISRCRVECVHVKTLHRQQSSQCTAWHLFTHLFMAHKTIHRSASKTLKRERKHINIVDAFVFNSFVFVVVFLAKSAAFKMKRKRHLARTANNKKAQAVRDRCFDRRKMRTEVTSNAAHGEHRLRTNLIY